MTKIMLKDTPGGSEFIDSLIEAIKALSFLYSHTPDDRARISLEEYIGRIKPGVIEAVGATKAPIILDGLRRAVMTRKHEIEACGASRA